MEDNLKPTELNANKNILSTLKKGANLSVGLLNGIVGDFLDKDNNGLAVQMQFYANEKPFTISKENIETVHKKISSKVCILIHGLTNDETIWNFANTDKQNYGTYLQNDFDYTPFYIRYNTGLHISENGKQFSQLIENLVQNYPVDIDEIVIIAHSMGGLVTRSACYYAPLQNAHWTEKISKLFFIGTPHLGAPLEKFGNALTHLLKTIPVSYTKIAGDVINLRSAGIKDLRYGYLTDEDWKEQHPDELLKNNKKVIPLLDDVDYYLITGTLTEDSDLPFDLNNHKEFAGLAHLKLVDSMDVYEQIKVWIPQKSSIKKPSHTKTIIPYNETYFPKENMHSKNKLNSVLDLTRTGLIGSIDKLETIQKSNLTYKILNQIPVVNVFSKEIENIHNSISKTVLKSSKTVLKKI